MSGCGGTGVCQCAGRAQAQSAMINGIALAEPGEKLDEAEVRERAWAELLRQEAVRLGFAAKRNVLVAPVSGPAEQEAIQRMLDEQVPLSTPSGEECRRYYEANKARFVEGQAVHMRHILFAVTDGVDVNQLAARAEQVLLELTRKDVPAGLFAQRAKELSNCPSGKDGGDLGWLGPRDCAEELAAELFLQKDAPLTTGLKTRLVHSRYGLHIVDVLERKAGEAVAFESLHSRIAMELAHRSRATALHQYIRLLAGKARVEGIELEAAETPLVQ